MSERGQRAGCCSRASDWYTGCATAIVAARNATFTKRKSLPRARNFHRQTRTVRIWCLYVFNVHSKHSHMHKNAKNLNQCSSSSLLPSRCVNVCRNTGSICECINIFCVGASQRVCGHPKLCFTSDATLFVGVIDAQALE